ncbi:hypothetical protein PENSTE_c025G07925 [Penicillium steckii]|uniref:Alpha/beta hydrolase fold-3 domain-containing protein n=1 Tax=Penicillium steckii TaxID=303698 RepID=A0A1V6SQ02_9EURO|nr:hypothetical protein PENSTE_c025G07925 [Penicillium steckii]
MAASHMEIISQSALIRLPPYDPEILAVKDTQHRPVPSSLEELRELRQGEPPHDDKIFNDPRIAIEKIFIPGADRLLRAIVLTNKSPMATSKLRPGILFLHSGGRMQWLSASNTDYLRRAPEVPGIQTLEDCYSSLVWMSDNLDNYNIDSDRFMISGVSAGTGLAAGTVLLSRDRHGPRVCAQLLSCPMLDDRSITLSSRQFENGRGFYTEWGRYAWKCVLGENAEEANVSSYVAPGRAEDLSHLPPAYIDAGSCEPFRDESILYAMKLWECGVQAELHIWAGGSHGFDLLFPTEIGAQATTTRDAWLKRALREETK